MNIIKGSALALALASASFAGGCMHDGDRHAGRYDHADRVAVALDFGTVRYGYDDGYWDNDHRWHSWNNDADMRAYRDRPGAVYHNWHHDRDGNDGWTN